MNIKAVENYIYEKLQKNLSPTLSYHGFHHTLDIVNATSRIAKQEGIIDEESLILLETAALYHDLGFISTYRGHEEEGSRIATLTLPHFHYSSQQIATILGMIMATKIPQQPKNIFEKIIADADLDYLGRNDFTVISHSLFLELREREMVENLQTWNNIQIKFLESHHYWTKSVIVQRNEQKMEHLKKLKNLVGKFPIINA